MHLPVRRYGRCFNLVRLLVPENCFIVNAAGCERITSDRENSKTALGAGRTAVPDHLINYLDRTALFIVSVNVRREFHLTESDYGHIVTLF